MMGGMGGFPNASGAGAGTAANNPWANPMMGNNAPNLDATLQMLENPMINQMMQNMMNNPEQMRMMMDSNPMMRQLRDSNPQMAAMLDNPETMRAMLDPNNLRAMAQMQQSLNQLSGSFPGMGLGGSMPSSMNNSGTAAPPQGGLDFSSLLGGSGTTGGGASAANPLFPFMMPPAGGVGAAGQPSSQPAPGHRFRVQLQNLQDMGFTDRSANIQALTSSHGNVNRAIEILLENPPEMGSSDSAADSNNAEAAAESNQAAVDDTAANNETGGGDSEPKGTTEKKND
jgi:ubiquilin